MSIEFNADEVFKIAEKIEANGAAFYRRAAELHPAPHNKEFLLKLAGMEDQHLATFSAMRAKLENADREETAYDPMGESLLYLKALADQHGGEGSPDAQTKLTGKETMEQVLRTAMDLERKSILFYIGLRDLVPARLGGDRIEVIIDEEKQHLVILAHEMQAAKTTGR